MQFNLHNGFIKCIVNFVSYNHGLFSRINMRVKQLFLLLALLITVAGNQEIKAANDCSKPNSEIGIRAIENYQINSFKESSFIDAFVNQEIKYFAPRSGRVYLVWKVENHSLESVEKWNNDTKLNDGLLYTPMLAQGDTFNVRLNIPMGSVLQYYFWITKSKKGHYQDFWDLQSSGKIIIETSNSIIVEANYSKKGGKYNSYISDKSWLILLILIVIYLGVLKLFNSKIYNKEVISQFKKVIFIGISLVIFQTLARSEIIGINPISIINDLKVSAKIAKASVSDILYTSCLIIPFLLYFGLVKKSKLNKWVYGLFISFTLFSTVIAFTNIKTVIYLGKPFNYQWLYYSDFLLSDESKMAMSTNLSLKSGINLISFCISMLLLSSILFRMNSLILLHKKVKYIIYSFFVFLFVIISYKSAKTSSTWTKGQSENAVTCMIKSIININSNSSFFTADIPGEMILFDPAQSIKMEDSIIIPKNHKVKNILLVILESAGAVYFDNYGGNFNLSPNLNKYSAHALTIETVYAHAPSTNRSLVSILGSIYPFISYKSITQESPQMEHPTISSELKNEGYRTSFFTSANLNFQNCREFLSYRSFDKVEDFSTLDCDDKFYLDSEDYIEGNGIDDMCLVDCLASWLDEDTTKKFFSLIWTVQGHYPYFYAGEEEDYGVTDLNFNRYLNNMKYGDELVGRVMQDLEYRGLDKSTLVVVVGDHGEAFGQHGQYGHATELYEENLRVPLHFINSILFNGQMKNDIAGLKDLATTAFSIIGVEIPDEWQGRDLLQTNSAETFFFAPWSDYLFGYRKNNMKYIFNESLNQVEIYDIYQDPKEKVNLINRNINPEVDYARNRIAAWVQFQDLTLKDKFGTKR